MIMFWNRAEVYSGFSMQRCSEIRELLASNGVKYTYKVINRRGTGTPHRDILESIVERVDFAYEYYVYIHKDDYDFVQGLMRKGNF